VKQWIRQCLSLSTSTFAVCFLLQPANIAHAAPLANAPEASHINRASQSEITDFSALRRHHRSSRHYAHQSHVRSHRYVRHVSDKPRRSPHVTMQHLALAAPAAQAYSVSDAPSYYSNAQLAPQYASERYATVRRENRRRRRSSVSATNANPAVSPFPGLVGSPIISVARSYLGTNPTGKAHDWCGNFMNLVLQRSGRPGSGSNLARSFASYGHRVSGPQVGAIAVMARRGGGHVGIVTGVDSRGNPIIISGNHNHTVAEATYPRGRIYAYVMP
jgi:uncharacterized protein (TIGR02594 family)